MRQLIHYLLKTLPVLSVILALAILPSSWACAPEEHTLKPFNITRLLLWLLTVILLLAIPAAFFCYMNKTQKIKSLCRYAIALIASSALSCIFILIAMGGGDLGFAFSFIAIILLLIFPTVVLLIAPKTQKISHIKRYVTTLCCSGLLTFVYIGTTFDLSAWHAAGIFALIVGLILPFCLPINFILTIYNNFRQHKALSDNIII